MAKLGEKVYQLAARERLSDAYLLIRKGHFTAGIYLSGRAVESILRAILWRLDHDYATGAKWLETGHDLRQLLTQVGRLGALRTGLRAEIQDHVQDIARLWSNDMRFWPQAKLNRQWYSLGAINSKRTLKRAARDFYDGCFAVITRCEALWQK